jgi:cell division protein FtsB
MRPRPLKRWLHEYWVLLGAVLMLAYFGYHAVHGQRGLLAWLDVSRELQRSRTELALLQTETGDLQAKVDALQPDRSDPDLVESELRRLGYIGQGEKVILEPKAPGAAR